VHARACAIACVSPRKYANVNEQCARERVRVRENRIGHTRVTVSYTAIVLMRLMQDDVICT